MNQDNRTAEGLDLTFFGQVNASISHELKNIFAIISETGGLLNDLTEMAAQGHELEPATVRSCIKDIIEEIGRGFEVVKAMNRFSHSVDEPRARVDVAEAAQLMTRMVAMLSYTGKCQVVSEAGRVVVETVPFRLQQLIYRILVTLFRAEGPDGEIKVVVQPEGADRANIGFSGFGTRHEETFWIASISELAASIEADVCPAEDGCSLQIQVPSIGNDRK